MNSRRGFQMLGIEFGGMNEVLADLHALTGEARYLRLAVRFNHHAVLDPLAEGRDALDRLHSNTQIPKVIGFARLAETTGEERYAKAARYFWGTVVHRRSFATGGNGDGEHFFPPAETTKHVGSAKTMETSDSGATWTRLSNFASIFNGNQWAHVQGASVIALGKAKPGTAYSAAVYVVGVVGGVWGVHRSDDAGATWSRFNDDAHQFGGIGVMAADQNVYGRIYFSGTGRGLLYSN